MIYFARFSGNDLHPVTRGSEKCKYYSKITAIDLEAFFFSFVFYMFERIALGNFPLALHACVVCSPDGPISSRKGVAAVKPSAHSRFNTVR